MADLDLSIIIVNWNSKDYLRKCLDTIFSETSSIEFEVIVIDGGSFDGCAQMLADHYPHVRFIQSEQNLGFAKANNEAFKVSKGRNILFLNPDTEIESDAINKLLSHLASIPNAGVVGARLLNSDRSVQTSCTRVFPTILNQLFDAEALCQRFPGWRLWGMAPLFDQSTTPTTVDAVSGACMMVKRSAFEDVGMFSDDYFMYSEDIDLCFKMRKAGLKTYYVPSANVLHHGGASSSKASVNIFPAIMVIESRWRFFRKHRSLLYGRLYRFTMFSASLFRISLLSFSWPIFRIRGKASLIEIALKKWTARLRWTLGLENWVKNY